MTVTDAHIVIIDAKPIYIVQLQLEGQKQFKIKKNPTHYYRIYSLVYMLYLLVRD